LPNIVKRRWIFGMALEQIEITLRNRQGETLPFYIDVYDSPLSHKWLKHLVELVENGYHLEKNYHWMGFEDRSAEFLCGEINKTFQAINDYNPEWEKQGLAPYIIDDYFSIGNTTTKGEVSRTGPGAFLIHEKTNMLHRYFEDLQGISGSMSAYYETASKEIKWHIRQLNLLCHEYETAVLSRRKRMFDSEWIQLSQLFCFLRARRFLLDPATDYELFGIDTLHRHMGGVYMGVNKSIGKHHYEVFLDENPDDLEELTTTAMRGQIEGSGDFDINWSRDTKDKPYPFIHNQMNEFRDWLIKHGFDPEDKSLTIGHPKIGQVNLVKSFGTHSTGFIQQTLSNYLDVYKIKVDGKETVLDYRWDDLNYMESQLRHI